MKSLQRFILSITLVLAVAAVNCRADVVVSFSEVGGNVEGTLSGSLDLANLTISLDDGNHAGSDFLWGTDESLFVLKVGSPSFDFYNGGTATPTGLNQAPSSFSGTQSFGFGIGDPRVHWETPVNGIATPTGTFVWSGQTLDSIGLGALDSTPITAFTAGNAGSDSDRVLFVVSTVPEPTSTGLLLACGTIGLLFRRRKRV